MAATRKKATLDVAQDLPHNLQAEQAVLGSALLSKDALFNVFSFLAEEDFYDPRHQLIYRAMYNLNGKHSDVDTLTVTEELINLKVNEQVGGSLYLKTCCDAMVAFSALQFYINIVIDQAVLRRLLIEARDIDAEYRTNQIDNVQDFIDQIEARMKDATSKKRISDFQRADSISMRVAQDINTPKDQGEDGTIGLSTGYPKLNKFTQGLQKGNMIVIAARPSVGKTAFALNIAYKIARTNVPVGIFSLEMSSDSLIKRLIGVESRVNLSNVNIGKFSDFEKVRVASAIKKIAAAPLYIDESSGLKIMDIIAKSRKLQANHPDLGLIVIDYLGLVSAPSPKGNVDSRNEEVRKISSAIKGLAKELKIPIIVISQLSRKVEDRRTENKRPLLSDLRDSGAIEQDADIVMLLYRGDYYESQAPTNKKYKDLSGEEKFQRAEEVRKQTTGLPGGASIVEVNVAKNRNGETGTAKLVFYKNFGVFETPSEDLEKELESMDTD